MVVKAFVCHNHFDASQFVISRRLILDAKPAIIENESRDVFRNRSDLVNVLPPIPVYTETRVKGAN